jgi:tRNA U34 2-thiouridine synthase MnmA/TrmU
MRVIRYLAQALLTEKTPNRCIVCIRRVKFKIFGARPELGIEYIANGISPGRKRRGTGGGS